MSFKQWLAAFCRNPLGTVLYGAWRIFYTIFEIDEWRTLLGSITVKDCLTVAGGTLYLALWIIGIVTFHWVVQCVFGVDFHIGTLD